MHGVLCTEYDVPVSSRPSEVHLHLVSNMTFRKTMWLLLAADKASGPAASPWLKPGTGEQQQ